MEVTVVFMFLRHCCALLCRKHLDFKYQSGVGRNNAAARTSGPVSKRGGNRKLALPANSHREHALVPSLNHLPEANAELEGLASLVRAVEFSAVFQRSSVVNRDRLAYFQAVACANDLVHVLES